MSISIGHTDVGIIDAFEKGFSAIDNQASSIKARMDEISKNPSADSTTKMLELQMEMGRYNSMIELTSNISKSITETLKSLAQKVN